MAENIIVSDVGGTNGRFGIANFSNKSEKPEISSIHVLPCKDFSSFAEMFATYLDLIEEELPKTAMLAVAGEVQDRSGYLWHRNWQFSAQKIEKQFSLTKVTFLNDYAALAHAIPHLSQDQIVTVSSENKSCPKSPYSVFGAGSGFGAAIGSPTEHGLNIIPTEIGHITYAPKTKFERDLFDYLEGSLDNVSIDSLISGLGIKRIYDFILHQNHSGNSNFTSHDITKAALEGSDETSLKTVLIFLSMLGGVSGDVALAHGAKGGIYIGGGIVPQLVSLIPQSDFLVRFLEKGPMRRFVEIVPIHIISTEKPGLLGAAMASL